jgi:hypothetical protein
MVKLGLSRISFEIYCSDVIGQKGFVKFCWAFLIYFVSFVCKSMNFIIRLNLSLDIISPNPGSNYNFLLKNVWKVEFWMIPIRKHKHIINFSFCYWCPLTCKDTKGSTSLSRILNLFCIIIHFCNNCMNLFLTFKM